MSVCERVSVRVPVRLRVCLCACVRACGRACVRARESVISTNFTVAYWQQICNEYIHK